MLFFCLFFLALVAVIVSLVCEELDRPVGEQAFGVVAVLLMCLVMVLQVV